MRSPGPNDELRRRRDPEKDLSINTTRICNIELNATVFGSAQNKPNPPLNPTDVPVGIALSVIGGDRKLIGLQPVLRFMFSPQVQSKGMVRHKTRNWCPGAYRFG